MYITDEKNFSIYLNYYIHNNIQCTYQTGFYDIDRGISIQDNINTLSFTDLNY
jgi:hypothetical protein